MKSLSTLRLLPILAAGALLVWAPSSYADNHGGGGGRGSGWHGGGRWHGGWGGYYGGWGWGGWGYPYYPYYWGPWGYGWNDDPYYGGGVYRGVPRYPESGSGNLATGVQEALKHRGYYTGKIDGIPGIGTRAAITVYQRDKHLPVTGRIDGPLIRSLGL